MLTELFGHYNVLSNFHNGNGPSDHMNSVICLFNWVLLIFVNKDFVV